MQEKPLVSIVILNLNGLKDTFKCLDSLKSAEYPNFEIIVVDNGSTENEADTIKEKYGNLVITHRLKKNKGYTGGNNWALKKTRGKYVVLLNNDTIVDKNWLDPMVSFMELNKTTAVIQPKILLLKRKKYFDYAGAAGGFIDEYGYPFARGRIFNTQEKDGGQYDGTSEISWASGAACMIRKSIIAEVGGLFDESLFNYMEEIDFCSRVWNKGYKVMFVSASVVYHKVAATAGKNILKKRYWEHRNNLLVYIKNFYGNHKQVRFFIRVVLELATYFYYIGSGQIKYIQPLFLAHIEVVKKLLNKSLIKERVQNHNYMPVYPGSIAFDYFIKNKTYFSFLNWSAKKSISFLIHSTERNTGNWVIFNQVNKLAEKGYEVKIYSLLGKSQNWFPLTVNIENITQIYSHKKPDVLVATYWTTVYTTLLIYAGEKYHFFQDWGEDLHKNALIKFFARKSYTFPIKKITISSYLENKARAIAKRSNINKITYATLNTKYFKPIPNSRKDMSKSGRIKILSNISWYSDCKGPDILVKAIKELRKIHPNYYFTLISREKKPYDKIIDNFVSNPDTKTIAKLYRESDVLLGTSRSEGFFIPGIEAMACGCPFITTDSGGVKEYLKNNINGILLSKPEDLWKRDVIENLLSDKKKLRQIIKNGHLTSRKYNMENIITELEKIYFITH